MACLPARPGPKPHLVTSDFVLPAEVEPQPHSTIKRQQQHYMAAPAVTKHLIKELHALNKVATASCCSSGLDLHVLPWDPE